MFEAQNGNRSSKRVGPSMSMTADWRANVDQEFEIWRRGPKLSDNPRLLHIKRPLRLTRFTGFSSPLLPLNMEQREDLVAVPSKIVKNLLHKYGFLNEKLYKIIESGNMLATFQRHQLFLKTNQDREWFRFVIHASFLRSWIRGLLPRSSWAWGKLLTRKTITAEGDTIRLCIGGKCKSCVPLLSLSLCLFR